MQLVAIRVSNFWSFGPEPVQIELDPMTYLLGPNGAGKTAVLTALARMFGSASAMRVIVPSDFHVPMGKSSMEGISTSLWIEVDFTFPEVQEGEATSGVPIFFSHMQLQTQDGTPGVRVRLTADMDESGEVEQRLEYVLAADEGGAPTQSRPMPRLDRQAIRVHYLPAKRNPAEHIAYSAASLLGKALRAANWDGERDQAKDLWDQLSAAMAGNAGAGEFGNALTVGWSKLHKGQFLATPTIAFGTGGLSEVLKQVSVRFTPGHEAPSVEFDRLSDGQQSLLYISLVLAAHAIDMAALNDENPHFDLAKLKPASFTLVAVEEPENSLSPQYLGRVIAALRDLKNESGGQAIVATHAPSILRRADPEHIRHLRLGEKRTTQVSKILLPKDAQESGKFVRQAVMAYPEIYFAKVVVLGEGDSEDIVLHRMLSAMGIEADASSVCVAPLGGRHVNHFWRLLSALRVPYVTLLDLDYGRYQGGWGRVKNTHRYLRSYPNRHAARTTAEVDQLPGWKDSCANAEFRVEIKFLEEAGIFFSLPIDLDFAMIRAFPSAYGVEPEDLGDGDKDILTAVLGKNGIATHYGPIGKKFFKGYHSLFKLGSKPAAHLQAMAKLTDDELVAKAPKELKNLCKRVQEILEVDQE